MKRKKHSRYSRFVAAAEHRTVDGIVFDSKREANRYRELRLVERAGEITDLKLQVRIPLQCGEHALCYVDSGRQAYYVADFVYLNANGDRVVEDTEGHKTDLYKLKKAVLATMGIELVET